MNLGYFISILLFSFNIISICAQNEFISANYTFQYNNYYSYLTINNPNGLNNFNDISGVNHMSGKSDDDVKYINRVSKSVSTNIPSVICKKYKSVTNIDLQSLGVEKIDDYSFRGCANLTYVYLYSNKIAEINPNSFVYNSMLQSLYLHSNKLTNLPENLFINQQKLETLQLDNNKELYLPNYIFRPLIKLRTLYMRSLQLTTAKPEWFETLGELRTLDLQSNQIEELPKNIFGKLVNITNINLRYNKFKVIHADSFGYFLSSPSIDLYGNKIYAVDEQFIYNVGPSALDLQSNICGEQRVNDITVYRVLMKTAFKGCFENYNTFFGQVPTTTEASNPAFTTQKGSTVIQPSGSIENRIYLLEYEVNNLTITSEQMTANWKNQYLISSNNQDEIERLKINVFDLQKSAENKDKFLEEIIAENLRLKNVTSSMQITIDAILKDKEIMQKNFLNNITTLNTELRNWQSQVRSLQYCISCPDQ